MVEEKLINILRTVLKLSEQRKTSVISPALINMLNAIKIFLQNEDNKNK